MQNQFPGGGDSQSEDDSEGDEPDGELMLNMLQLVPVKTQTLCPVCVEQCGTSCFAATAFSG